MSTYPQNFGYSGKAKHYSEIDYCSQAEFLQPAAMLQKFGSVKKCRIKQESLGCLLHRQAMCF